MRTRGNYSTHSVSFSSSIQSLYNSLNMTTGFSPYLQGLQLTDFSATVVFSTRQPFCTNAVIYPKPASIAHAQLRAVSALAPPHSPAIEVSAWFMYSVCRCLYQVLVARIDIHGRTHACFQEQDSTAEWVQRASSAKSQAFIELDYAHLAAC